MNHGAADPLTEWSGVSAQVQLTPAIGFARYFFSNLSL